MGYVYQDTVRGAPRNALTIPAPTEDVLREQFAQTFEENPIMAAKRWSDLREDQKTGPMLPAETARQKLRDAGLENDLKISDAGITQAALDTLMFRKRIEKKRQETFARAEGGLAEGAGRLGIAFATSLVDPISAGLNFVPVVGQVRYARWLASAGSMAGRIGVRAGVGAVEGIAGAALMEPFIYGMRTQEQADYDSTDSLLNVAFGGVVGSGLHVTVGSVGELFSRLRTAKEVAPRPVVQPVEPLPENIRQAIFDQPRAADIVNAMPPEAQQATLRAAVGQAIEGRPINVEPIVAASSGNEIIGFTTARGSEYEIADSGVTTRNKAARADVGHEGDFGPQPTSEATYYVKSEEALALGEFQTQGTKKAIQSTGDGRIGVKYLEGPNAGKFERRTVVTPQKEPAVGLTPVETWKGGEIVHFGNEITSVRTRPKKEKSDTQASFSQPDQEYRAATEQAEATLARDVENTTEANLKAAEEEADLAVAEAKELGKRLGVEMADDADFAAINEAAERAERWARAAELATVCLVRGG